MPLRYSKDRMKILKSVAALQKCGALDETLFREFLRWYGKALRELQRAEDKKRWDVLRRVTKPIATEDVYKYIEKTYAREVPASPERDVPALTPEAEALRTLLLDHGSDAYKKLVQGAKIGPLFGGDR